MPTFDCDQCDETFNSRTKLEQHEAAVHSDDGAGSGETGWIDGLRNLFTWKGGLTVAGVVLMIALPLGGVMFYSSLAPDTSSPQDEGQAQDTIPPTGLNLQGIPTTRPTGLTIQTSYDRQLSREEQLYLLWYGGPAAAQIQQSRQIRPTVLLQYRCQNNCTRLQQRVEAFARRFNGNTRWIQTAPYSRMDSRIAVTFPAKRPRRFSSFNATRIRQYICNGITLRTGSGRTAWSSMVPVTACHDYDFGGSGNLTPVQ